MDSRLILLGRTPQHPFCSFFSTHPSGLQQFAGLVFCLRNCLAATVLARLLAESGASDKCLSRPIGGFFVCAKSGLGKRLGALGLLEVLATPNSNKGRAAVGQLGINLGRCLTI